MKNNTKLKLFIVRHVEFLRQSGYRNCFRTRCKVYVLNNWLEETGVKGHLPVLKLRASCSASPMCINAKCEGCVMKMNRNEKRQRPRLLTESMNDKRERAARVVSVRENVWRCRSHQLSRMTRVKASCTGFMRRIIKYRPEVYRRLLSPIRTSLFQSINFPLHSDSYICIHGAIFV